jgi:glycosyltransferase involved in cell wall biosynthesis
LYLQELLRDLLKNADVSCLVVTARDGPLRDELEALGAVVHVTDYPFPDHPMYEARIVELAGLIRAYGAQVVVVNTLISAPGADAARRLDLPTVWAIHESYTLEDYWLVTCGAHRMPALAAATARTVAETTAVLFEADATRDLYARAAGGDRLATLHYGIDLAAVQAFAAVTDRDAARRSIGLAADATVLACVGNFEPRKGQAALVSAFALVAAEFPEARLALVGQKENDYARGVAELVHRLGLDGRVQIRAAELSPYRWFRAADGFVVPSDLESMPRVLLEAMAFGVPVVATDVWGIPELVRDGENGFLVPPRNVTALSDALRSLLRLTPTERAQLGQAGSGLVRDRHDLARYRRVFERLLRGVVADPDTRVPALLGS